MECAHLGWSAAIVHTLHFRRFMAFHSEIRTSNSLFIRNHAKTNKTRRCRTDTGEKEKAGLYFPNILVSSLIAISTPQIRPQPSLLDSSLNNWILGSDSSSRRAKIIQKAESTATVYVTFVPVGKAEQDRIYLRHGGFWSTIHAKLE